MKNNAKLYKDTYNHILVDPDVKAQIEKNIYKNVGIESVNLRGDLKGQRGKKKGIYKFGTVLAGLLLLFMTTGTVCFATTGDFWYVFSNSLIIQGIFEGGDNTSTANSIQQNSVYVSDQVVNYKDYNIHFYGYYAEETTGVILAEFLFTDNQNNKLSDELYSRLESTEIDIRIENDYDGAQDGNLDLDENGNAILTCRYTITPSKDSPDVSDIKRFVVEETPTELPSTRIGSFDIPDTIQKLDSLAFDTSESILVEKITISGLAMHIVFDDNYAREKFEEELKASGVMGEDDYDPEEHGYDYYEYIIFHMKDGTSVNVDKKYESTDFSSGGYGTGPKDGKAYRTWDFNYIIDVNQIECLEMDGVIYYPE